MSEELHEITYLQEVTETYTRAQIEEIATGAGFFEDVVLACREWLANNPQGMTRAEFDKLPDGTVVAVAFGVQFMVSGGMLWASDDSDAMVDRCATDDDLRRMKVVSTPPAPKPWGWVDRYGFVWRRHGPDRATCVGTNGVLTPAALSVQHGPLTRLLPGPQIGGEA